ncbi:MAG: beta strand repeat-containing protein [Thermoanaerobaculia bacterium]
MRDATKVRSIVAALFAILLIAPAATAQFSQQGGKISGTGAVGAAGQAWSVAISGDGSTAIVGGPGDDSGAGAAWVFTQSGGVWSQQGGKLVGTGATGAAQQGSWVAISTDGNTAIVGGSSDDSGIGAAWIYTRTAGVWSQQGGKLVGSSAVGAAQQGASVAISGDGNTALVGGYGDNSYDGATWVFTRSGGVWSQQGSKLVGTGASASAYQGASVSISGDGNTAISGGPGDSSNAGATWVFTRSGGVWSQVGSKLVGTAATGAAQQGTSAAISADGTTAVVGGYADSSNAGAAWVFTQSGGVWTQQGSKLVGTGATAVAGQGIGVGISTDGNTVIVGGPYDSSSVGAAWVYMRSGGIWSQQGTKLIGTGAVGKAQQGSAVAISGDGNTALVGGQNDNSYAGVACGATWVFTRTGGVWSQQGDKLVGTGAVGIAKQGTSVAISADGNTAIVGGPQDGSNTGAAWVFTRSGGAWSQQGGKLVGTGAVGAAQQGKTVAISADGNTAIVGGPGGDGGAWVFTRSGGIWSQQGPKLLGDGETGVMQGTAVAISGDGNTAIVGGPWDASGAGAAWIFTRSGGVWSQLGSKLVGTLAVGKARQGSSVAISADGSTAMIGGPLDSTSAGAAWVFMQSGGVWSQQGGKLVGTGAVYVGLVDQGWSVALSADGNTAVVGGWGDNSGVGAAWVYTRSGGVWSQPGGKLVGTGAVGKANQGNSVTISADGNTLLVGGPYDSTSAGAVWVYARSGGVWSQLGSKLVGTGAAGTARQGWSAAISADGTTAVVGGLIDNSNAGAAWVFVSSASQLAFVQQPSTTTAGQPITPSVTVQLQDGGGSPVAEGGVTITMSLSSGTGTLGGTLSQVTNASGLATFNDLSINLAGSKQLTAASAGRTSAVSNTFTIAAGAAASLVASGGTPQFAFAGGQFEQPLQVTVTDTLGNPVVGALVTYSAPLSGPSAVLSDGGSATTDANGHASVTATANGVVGGPYLVTATTGTLPAVTFSLTNVEGEARAVPALGGPGLLILALLLSAVGTFFLRTLR